MYHPPKPYQPDRLYHRSGGGGWSRYGGAEGRILAVACGRPLREHRSFPHPGHCQWGALAVVDGTILRLLATGELINPCHGEEPFEADPCQAVGGVGHELGHLFRLPHTCQRWPQPNCQQSIMDAGWIRYPNSILVEEERVELAAGSFFALDERLKLTTCSAG